VPKLKPGVRVLEIGCGTGQLLSILRSKYGAEVQGVERSDAAVAACRDRGVAVYQGALEDAGIGDASVDAVIMRHVLEHVPSPRALLAEVRRILAPGGVLLLTVPVTGGWDHRMFGRDWDGYRIPEHLFHFPVATLDRLLADAGLVVRVRSHSWVPNPWINSAQRILERRGSSRAARAASIRNPVALVLAAPLSAAAAVARRSGRLTVLAGIGR
jgi:SAM-dependent methyltransferase